MRAPSWPVRITQTADATPTKATTIANTTGHRFAGQRGNTQRSITTKHAAPMKKAVANSAV